MKRSKHSLSHMRNLTCKMGKLVPITWFPVLPGDSIQHMTSGLIRVAPLVTPVMHPVRVRIHHWFVPYRLIWNDWENFITGGPDGLNASTRPYINITESMGESTLPDYLGIDSGFLGQVSALPFRAYNLIWNEFYRDQDLETAQTIDLTDGEDTTTNTDLLNVSWEKDYFTTARPWTQKGADINIPLSGTANITRDSNAGTWKTFQAGTNTPGADQAIDSNSGNLHQTAANLSLDPDGGLSAVLDDANDSTINELRLAFALQRYEEARARYGSRYTEYLRYLGVRSSDARLQRPEYLGGGKQTIQFSEVLATAQTGTDVDVGDMKGHGIAAMRSNRYRRFFEEHGCVLTLMSVVPKNIYGQAMQREWFKTTKEDYWQKELELVGQQEVYKKELSPYFSTPDEVFGYIDRYEEYRRHHSTVAGQFRDTSMNTWNLARIFGSEPSLNADFVKCEPTTRVYQATWEDQLWCMFNNSIQARRLVRKSGGNSIVL